MQFNGLHISGPSSSLAIIWHFLITFHVSPIIPIFVLLCPIIILFLPAHSHLFLSSSVFVFVLCVSSLLFCLLSLPSGDSLSLNPLSISFLIVFPLPSGDLVAQCGFFKRSERRPHYETEFYRAHLGVQPSEVEKQASEL